MYQQHFFIEGRHFGSCARGVQWRQAEPGPPTSFWFLCPLCGEQWAKVITPESRACWQPVVTSCKKCGGGSMHRPWDEEYTENLPLPVLLWEFQRELEKYDRRNDDESS